MDPELDTPALPSGDGVPRGAPASPGRRRRSLPVRLVAGLARTIAVVLCAVVGLVGGVLCFLLVPDADLLRRAALPVAQAILHHDRIHIGAFELSPLTGLEIRELWVGPPKGFAMPLATISRITVRYDLSGILGGEIAVRKVLVERPIVRVENRGGKLSWLAFLEGLPKSEPKPEPPPSEPSDLRVRIDRVSVIGFGALVDDGKERAALERLDIALAGHYSRKKTHIDLAVRLEGAEAAQDRANVAVLLRGESPLGGRLRLGLTVDVALDMAEDPLASLRAVVEVGLRAATREVKAPFRLDPVELAVDLGAAADFAKQRAGLTGLTVRFNGSELLALDAGVIGLPDPKEVELRLSRLTLPLARLAPYAKAFVRGVDFGGEVRVRDLHVAGPLSALKEKKLVRLGGLVELENVWAKTEKKGVAGLEAIVRDLDARIALAARGQGQALAKAPHEILASLPELASDPGAARAAVVEASGAAAPAVSAHGRIHLGEVKAAGVRISGLELRLAGGADLVGLAPAGVGAKLKLKIPSLTYTLPGLGTVSLSIRTSLQAGGDLARRSVAVDRLELAVGDLLDLRLKARAEEFGKKSFAADLEVQPIDLARAVAAAPAGVRAKLGGLRPAGRVGLVLHAKGRTPAPHTPPLRLPVELDTLVTLAGISVKDRERGIDLAGLDGTIAIKGKPQDLALETDLRIASLRHAPQQLVVEKIAIPLRVHATLARTTVALGLGAGAIRKNDLGLAVSAFKHGLKFDAQLPLEKLVAGQAASPGRIELEEEHGFASVRMKVPGSSLTVDGMKGTLSFRYDPARTESVILKTAATVGSFKQAEQGIEVKGIALSLEQGLEGYKLRLPSPPMDLENAKARLAVKLAIDSAVHGGMGLVARGITLEQRDRLSGLSFKKAGPKLDLAALETGLDLRVGKLKMKGALDPEVKDTSVKLDAALRQMKDLELRSLAVRVPTRGVKLDLSGEARDLTPEALARAKKSLPPFDLRIGAFLDAPRATDPRRATLLAPKMWGGGRAGLSLRARRVGPARVLLEGAVEARGFNLWTKSEATEPREGGGVVKKTTRVHLKDLDAAIPIRQEVLTAGGAPLPPPKKSVLEGASAQVLYNELRPYAQRRAPLSIGGVTLDDTIVSVSREGYLLSTTSRRTAIDRILMDLAIDDATLMLRRLYVKIFGGDIAGEIHAQVLSLKPLDARLHLFTQVTGLNLAYLDAEAKERTEKTEVSAMIDTKVWLSKRFIEARIDITRLSLDMLDSLLAYLDPNKGNASVQSNRKLINSWYTKFVNPRVTLVSIWVDHGNLNMDIEMEAWSFVGSILKRVLKNMQIRRLNIVPILNQYL
jgi:hypothetical protein